ncbi:MAG: PIG-L family deacetylase [Candidatus Doudnabacteria bacterium]|nr:PIG-L family deacetylase [Candidatus Doudnabacteria bacterium]
MNSSQSTYALAILAHPDDEAFLLAGTSLKLGEQDKKVALICATTGEKGVDRLSRNLTPEQMAIIRTNELKAACGILGCDCKKIFDFGDGMLDQVNFDELVNVLKQEINSLKPQIIMTFGEEGISGHRDHIMIGRATVAATQIAGQRPNEIWRACIPASLIDNFCEHLEQRKVHRLHFVKHNLKGVPDERLTKIDITKYKDQKIKALEAHRSQYLPHLTWPYFLECECFEIIKLKP